MKVLVLGGTHFLGPYIVEGLLESDCKVSLFNRGTQSHSFSRHVEQLKGDRDGDLKSLEGRQWDAVIDTCGHLPRVVAASSQMLTSMTSHYTFISTVGVYANFDKLGIPENDPLTKLVEETSEEITEKTYGALKAGCEKVIEKYFADRCLIIRPGLIIGPRDPTERFTYWPTRIAEGGNVLVPNIPNYNLQFIDVRDLANWIIRMIGKQGIYNATGPGVPLSFQQLFAECQKFSNNEVILNWVPEDFLIQHHVQDWTELPLWLSKTRNMPGFLNVNVQKAIDNGLAFRPLSETISATLEWHAKNANKQQQFGLNRDKERELLEKWKYNH